MFFIRDIFLHDLDTQRSETSTIHLNYGGSTLLLQNCKNVPFHIE